MQRTSYFQKIAAYLLILAVLVVVLWFIGRPARFIAQPGGDVHLDLGGKLSQLRDEAGFTESRIGEIDPASSTVKLATFGLRGVAIALLWHRSQEYQKRKDWNNVIAVSSQLVLLEPHFTSIWEFLGWNFSYNASAEFDDYRERYRWVIRGIDLLIEGCEYNKQAPKLCKATGWQISQKIGIADENEQYRRLLREDDAFWQRHDKLKLPSERDNWILGRKWYQQGENLIQQGYSIGNESDFLYFSNSRLNLFNYAMWKRKDGIFGAEAIRAWENAGNAWQEFGQKDLSTAIPDDGSLRMKTGVKAHRTKLEVTDLVKKENQELLKELDSLSPGLREKTVMQRWKELGEVPGQQGTLIQKLEIAFELKSKHDEMDYTDFQTIRKFLDKNEPDWRNKLKADVDKLYTKEQLELKKIPLMLLDDESRDIVNKADGAVGQVGGRAISMVMSGPKVIAQEMQGLDIPREAKGRARDIAEEIDKTKQKTRYSDLFRDILNYDYRFREVAVERTQDADDARKKRYFARKAYYDGNPRAARDGWVDAMKRWEDLINKKEFADVAIDSQFIREIIDIVEKYVIILDNINEIFTGKEPLQGLIRNKLKQENDPAEVYAALEYAKGIFAKGDYAKCEEYFSRICGRFESINGSIEFMKLAPLPDLRDKMLEANAFYIKTLRKLNKPLPEQLPLRSFVELMMKHDDAFTATVDSAQAGYQLISEGKWTEAQTAFDKTIEIWKPLLDKYPLISLDPTLQNYAELKLLTAGYLKALQEQKKELPKDFILNDFVK